MKDLVRETRTRAAAYESLLKVPSGAKLLNEYAISSNEHIYIGMVDIEPKKGDGVAGMVTIADLPIKHVNKDKTLNVDEFNTSDASARKVVEQFNLQYKFKQDGEIMHFVGINMYEDNNLKLDKYDLMFALYHEVYAHVKTKGGQGEQHRVFGNYYYTPGMRLMNPDVVGGTNVVYGTEAWKVFKEILELKVKNNDADEQNRKDYQYMTEKEKFEKEKIEKEKSNKGKKNK